MEGISDTSYIALYLIFAGIVGAAVAQAKGAPIFAGFAWGIVLGPIGWIIAAIVLKPRVDERKAKQAAIAEKMARARALAEQQNQKPPSP